MTRAERLRLAHVEDGGAVRVEGAHEWRLPTEERAAVQLDDHLHVRRPRRLRPGCVAHELLAGRDERAVRRTLAGDRRRRVSAEIRAAQRSGEVAGEDADVVA